MPKAQASATTGLAMCALLLGDVGFSAGVSRAAACFVGPARLARSRPRRFPGAAPRKNIGSGIAALVRSLYPVNRTRHGEYAGKDEAQ